MEQRKKIGDILVEAGIITQLTLDRALARQAGTSHRIGIILEEMGVITEEELAQALAKQTGCKSTSGFANYSFPKELLGLVPDDIAIGRLVFPLKRNDTTLALATTDPADVETMETISRKTGLRIMPVLAPRHEIQEAVRRHYLAGETTEANGRKKILVVEDSPSMLTVLKNTLEEEGYLVLTAKDGLEGLKLAVRELPDLIVTDATMPKMDGQTMMRNLQGVPETATIPAILLTSKTAAEVEKMAFEDGFMDFITKPAQPMRVASRVKRAFQIMENIRNAGKL